jgi:hypothetical protein
MAFAANFIDLDKSKRNIKRVAIPGTEESSKGQ